MPMQAILFDLDGTLLDTLVDLADAANRTLDRAGLPTHPVAAYRYFVGDGSRMLISRALPENHRDPARIDDYLARFKDDYGRNWKTATRPYPGIRQLLADLTRRNIPRAVVTNKPHRFAAECIRHFFPDTPFQTIRGQKNHLPRKPDPAPALEAADSLRVAPKECLFVGDSNVDMATAIAAGMAPVGVSWGFRSVEELIEAGASRIVSKPQDVLQWIHGNTEQ